MIRQHRSSWKLRAQGLVEFALIVPVLLLTLFGIIDLGWIVFNYSQVYNSLREATRYGSVSGFVTPPQMVRCDDIKNRILGGAGFSGVKANQVTVWYDDGRSIPDAEAQPTLPPDASPDTNVVAICQSSTFTTHEDSYDCQAGVSCPDRGTGADFGLINGDRVVIDVNVNVPFLTPFFRAMVPNGVNMHLRNARSIFPDGLAS
jgi:hypothetical protein